MKKKAIIILGIVIVFIIAFIWGNSILSPALSDKISRTVGDILSGIIGSGDETTTVGGFSVRKLGHFFEFFALGCASWLLFKFLLSNKTVRTLAVVLTGISVPLLDETIQIFSGRGHSVKDVWIDISGFAVGVGASILAVVCVSALVKHSKNKHK